MNLSQKFVLGFLITLLFVGVTGFISIVTNYQVKYAIEQIDESSHKQVENLTKITFALQSINTFNQQLLTEKYKEFKDVKYIPNAQKEIKQNINNQIKDVETNIDLAEQANQKAIQLAKKNKVEEEQAKQNKLKMLEEIKTEFSQHKKLIAKYTILVTTNPDEAEKLLKKNLESQFTTNLFPLIREYERELEVVLAREIRELKQVLNNDNSLVISATGLSLFTTIVFGFILSNSILKSINKLINAADAIEITDAETKFEYVNPEFEKITKINKCFLSFGTEPTENINRLTALCGELLGATSSLYNRLDKGMLYAIGQWQTPAEYNLVHKPEGYCYDIIEQGSEELVVVNDLPNTTYAQTDANVMLYGLKTCIGQAVKCKNKFIGSLCAFYQKDFIPNDTDKKVMGIIAAAIKVEEERRFTQEALKESEERYALAARGANDGLWDWNLKTNEVYFSLRCKEMLGCEEDEVGNSFDEYFNRVHPEDLEQLMDAIASHIAGVTPYFENEHRKLHKDGTYRWVLSRGLAVRNADGKADRIAGSQTDITKRKQAEQKLLHEACHDRLTGLPNRLLFMNRLEQAIKRAKRSESCLFAVLFLDIDRFKVVNDSLGHNTGDQLLIAIARKLETCLRPGDAIARLGGDEFIILLENIKSVTDATLVADRIVKELKLPFKVKGYEIFTGVSIGITLNTIGYDQAEDLLRDADVTMYRAKALGRGRYEVFDRTIHNQAMALLQLENDLRQAIARQELQLYYQPIVSLKSGTIKGFEALIRWYHPVRGIVSPLEFIPLAEETGLIMPIGFWVLREACRQMQVWQGQFPANPSLKISVNLSGKQFMQPDLVEQIDQILQETGLDARSLGLEITESALMENAESVIDMLTQLRNLGIGLHIDDFGTGYSSLSYLHRFPIDTLKVDRSFVNNVDVDPEKIEIIRTVVGLAWNLGMEIVAEGVETKMQMYQIKALQCEFAQGYFFSKPLDSQAAGALLATQPQYVEI